MGGAAFFGGDFVAARTHLEQARSLADSLLCPMPHLRGGFVAGVEPLVWLELALWALGYADQAQQRSQEALALAQQVEHPPSQWVAGCFAAMLSQCRRDVAGTRAYAEAAMALAAAQGFAHRVELSRILWGWALVLQGDAAADVTHIRQGEKGSRGLGPEVAHPYWLSVLTEALTVAATTEARWWDAEIYRFLGYLLLSLPRPYIPQAEVCFQRALEVARRQQAKALELRAAISLSRLWQQHDHRTEARQLLEVIYHWFTEGFDTADLQTAKALLEELA